MLARNRRWAERKAAEDPTFFSRLAEQQKPHSLWIGCSDSRVPATQIVDVPPGEIFVHRNVANLVVHSDLNVQSVIQFAVDVLGVRQILVCGHYGCSGVAAAAEGARHGLVDHWLRHVSELADLHQRELEDLPDPGSRIRRLTELNVEAQVAHIAATLAVQDAWQRGQTLSIHGWVYDIADGVIRDLGVSRDG